jgi:DNA modification methylase
VNRVILGNCIEVLKTLDAGSVQCCVTSPPYYGLRDYGTAQWTGGDPECDHAQKRGGNGEASKKQTTSEGTQVYQYKDLCAKCGAIRTDEQIGLEERPEAFVQKLVEVFREVRRVLADDGTLWVNLGDSYVGSANTGGTGKRADGGEPYKISGLPPKKGDGLKPKDLIGIPWMVAFALRADGWYLRSDIIWHKPNPMPESVTDRPTKSHEYIFLLSKSAQYYYDAEAIAEPAGPIKFPGGGSKANDPNRNDNDYAERARHKNLQPDGQQPNGMHLRRADGLLDEQYITRNKRSVWTVTPQPYKEAHFATFPPDLIEPCILAGSREGDTVLDPFNGSGTTGAVSIKHHRSYIGIELNPAYVELTNKRFASVQPVLFPQVQS